MKLMKEISFQGFIIIVMLGLAFVAWDMSKPVLRVQSEIMPRDVVTCLVHPFTAAFEYEYADISVAPGQGYNFFSNILLPLMIYMVSIGGFIYLLWEDFKLLKRFAKSNKTAKFFWSLWIIILISLLLIPIFFGMHLLMKGFVIAVITTALLLIILGMLYSISYTGSKSKKP
jgi:FlaA1/EpsC-like NDP-sugar epimerase